MSRKNAIDIPAFGGINKSHTRKPSQPSEGKNFWTVNGSIRTRDGLTEVTEATFTDPIYSLHSCKEAQVTENLIVQSGSKLYRTLLLGHEGFLLIQEGIDGFGYSNTYRGYLVISFGTKLIAYNVSTGNIGADLRNLGAPGAMFTATWKDYLFTIPGARWAPAYQLQFNGYDYEPPDPEFPDLPPKIIDRDIFEWPEEHNIKVHDGSSVVAALPMASQLFIITEEGTWHLYGNNEDDFELIKGSRIGGYRNPLFGIASLVADYPMWLGNDNRVYMFTGSVVESISQPIDELLEAEDAAGYWYPRVYGFGRQFWLLVVRGLYEGQGEQETTTAYVFDTNERAWSVMEFGAHILCMCRYDNQFLFGTKDGKILRMDDASDKPHDLTEPVTTEIVLGPYEIQGRKLKFRSLHLNAEPRNVFTISVTRIVDDKDESDAKELEFTTGRQMTKRVKIGGKGQNVAVRLTTTDRVNELQGATLVYSPRRLK